MNGSETLFRYVLYTMYHGYRSTGKTTDYAFTDDGASRKAYNFNVNMY